MDEVAKRIGVRKESIYRRIDKKGFPAHRAGRLLLFKLAEVDEWVRGGGKDSDDRNTDDDLPPGEDSEEWC